MTSLGGTVAATLACAEVWGGSGRAGGSLALPGFDVWVYSNPAGSGQDGGDVHYLSVCDDAILSRICLADVSGHGQDVMGPATILRELMRRHINTWDQRDLVGDLNRAFYGSTPPGTYATALVLSLLENSADVALTNAGHPPPLHRRREGGWTFLPPGAEAETGGPAGLPVGLIFQTTYQQSVFRVEPGDSIVLYTDGITEAADPEGNMLGQDGLLSWIATIASPEPAAIGTALVERLQDFRGDDNLDDETVIVIQKVGTR